jgi:putative transposase
LTITLVLIKYHRAAGARSIADIVTGFSLPLSPLRAKGVMLRLGLVNTPLPNHRYKKASRAHDIIANKHDRQFTPATLNQVWWCDLTYIWTGQRWSYLPVVLDLYARKPIG